MVNFNHEKYIDKAIESVINQTYKNWELIVIDDGSTDSSPNIIKQYNDERINPFFLKQNCHISMATNIGFSKVQGEYIARIDSDDVWEIDKLEKQLRVLENTPGAQVCFTKVDIINEKGALANVEYKDLYNLYNSRQKDREGWIRFFFFIGNSLLQTILFRSELLKETGGFNLAYMQAHDFDFLIRLAVL